MRGRRPHEGFRPLHQEGQKLPGALRPAKRYPMQRPRSHAVFLSAAPDALRGGSVPLAQRPSRGAPRRLPLPHLASSEDRYVRFAHSTPEARNPRNFRKSTKNSHMAYTK